MAVFGVALAARLAFWLLADQPLLYSHQYHYFTNGLRIFENPHPLHYLIYSDEWRTWAQHWTIAPLYYPFEAVVFFLFGPHLAPLRFVQCVLGAVTAVTVGAMGREAAGPRGWLAGLAYGLYGYSIELPTWTLTENLHNAMLAVAAAMLLRSVPRPSLGLTAAGGALLGLSALARSVSSAFLPVAALWRWFYAAERARVKAGAALLLCGLAMILPWSARNVFVIGDLVPIETTAYENIWYANHFTDPERFQRQLQVIAEQPTPAAKRSTAMYFALRGIRRSPGAFVEKVRSNFWHFFRPEGLHNLFTIERTQERWRHVFSIVLEDGIIALALPFFVAYIAAARRTAAWAFIALWSGYYLFFEVVVFLNEVPRHRAGFVPFFLAGAAGGAALLADASARRGWRLWPCGLSAPGAPCARPARPSRGGTSRRPIAWPPRPRCAIRARPARGSTMAGTSTWRDIPPKRSPPTTAARAWPASSTGARRWPGRGCCASWAATAKPPARSTRSTRSRGAPTRGSSRRPRGGSCRWPAPRRCASATATTASCAVSSIRAAATPASCAAGSSGTTTRTWADPNPRPAPTAGRAAGPGSASHPPTPRRRTTSRS